MPGYNNDFYKLLGVNRNDLKNLSTEQIVALINNAYRNQIKIYHPDRNPGFQKEANEKAKLLNEARAILADPTKRREYDLEFFGIHSEYGTQANTSPNVKAEARAKAQAEARAKAEAEARAKAEAETRVKSEAEAKSKAKSKQDKDEDIEPDEWEESERSFWDSSIGHFIKVIGGVALISGIGLLLAITTFHLGSEPSQSKQSTTIISPTNFSNIDIKWTKIPFSGFNPLTSKVQIANILGSDYTSEEQNSMTYNNFNYFGLNGGYTFNYDDGGNIIRASWNSEYLSRDLDSQDSLFKKKESDIVALFKDKYPDFKKSFSQNVAMTTAYNFSDEYNNKYTMFIGSSSASHWHVYVEVFPKN